MNRVKRILNENWIFNTNISRQSHPKDTKIRTSLTLSCFLMYLFLMFGLDTGWSKFFMVTCFSILSAVIYVSFSGLNKKDLGFTITPDKGWLFWIKIYVIFILLPILLLVLILKIFSFISSFSISIVYSYSIKAFVLNSLFVGPILEEIIFRLIFCTWLKTITTTKKTIILTGLAFAVFHIIGGTANISNQIGGFILSWSYLRSSSIFVPILLHFFGNLSMALLYCMT